MADVVSWPEFLRRFDWRQGEHVTAIGHTGSGKSHLVRSILERRSYSVVFGSKPRDPTLRGFRRDGWRRIQSWPPDTDDRRVLLWPSVREADDLPAQRDAFRDAFRAIFAEGGWCVYLDELPYLANTLGLAEYPELLWQQGRALGISLVVATQRPRHVPLLAYSQATHLFLWRSNDAGDTKRLAEIGGVSTRAVAQLVAELPRFAFLYVNSRDGALVVSRAPAPK